MQEIIRLSPTLRVISFGGGLGVESDCGLRSRSYFARVPPVTECADATEHAAE